MAKTKYSVTNYGNTRTVYVKGKSWEISKGSTVEFTDKEVPEAEEVAAAFEKLPFMDVKVIKQLQAKIKTRKTKKKKVTAKKKKSKKIKRCKVKRRKK